MIDLSNEKIAIYIDTSSLFKGRIFDLCSHINEINQLIKLISCNENLFLLKNDILDLEIEDKFQLPSLKRFFDKDQTKVIEEIFHKNKKNYQEAIHALFSVGIKFDLNISHEDIMDGCQKQYRSESPWSDKKQNEWKDFFMQRSLIKYYEECNNYDKLVILSCDHGFNYIKNETKRIDVRNTNLKGFISYITEYIEYGKESFESSLINNLSLKEEEITKQIEEGLFDEEGIYLMEPEIFIEDIKIIDSDDKDRIHCEVEALVSGTDLTNATYDKEDNRYYNEEYYEGREKYDLYTSIDNGRINFIEIQRK